MTRVMPCTGRICNHVIARSSQSFLIVDDPVMEAGLPNRRLTRRYEARNRPRRTLFGPAHNLPHGAGRRIVLQPDYYRVYMVRHHNKRIDIHTAESFGNQ